MMGPKRMSIVKEPSGQHVEITKRKASVSAVVNRAPSQKIQENTSTIKKSVTSGSLNVQASTNKSQNRQASPVKQIRKSNQSTTSVTQPKTTPRTSVTSVKNQVSVPKKLVRSPSKISSTNLTRERNQVKEAAVDLVKPVNKNKGFKSKTESRLSVPLLHPVALIRDESKTFKEKFQNKANKKPQTATLVQRTPRSVNVNAANNEPKLMVKSSSTRFSTLSDKDIDSVTVCLDEIQRISKQPSDFENKDAVNVDTIDNSNYYRSDFNCFNKKLQEGISRLTYGSSEDICVCNFDKDLTKENREEMCDNSKPGPMAEFKTEFQELNNDLESKLESNIRSNAPTCDNAETSYFPSFYPQMMKPKINEIDRVSECDSESEIKIQSREYFASAKKEDSDKKENVESSFHTSDLQNLEGLSKEMKQSVSATTMESSFDTKTFILEKPFDISYLDENSWGNDKKIVENLEKELFVPNNQQSKPPETVKSVLQVNELDEHKGSSSTVTTKTPMTPEKGITEVICDKVISNKSDVNNGYEVDTALSRNKKAENEDIFDSVDTLEVLNLASVCNVENNILGISDEILFSFLPNQQSDKVALKIYDEDDEFAPESEDVVQTIDLGNSVWMDYKMPLNKPKPDDDSEIWIFDRETDDSYHDDVANEETIVFLEPDEKDWIITEKNLDDLRACLDECKEEAEYAAKEINRLSLKTNYQLTTNRRRSNSSIGNRCCKKSNLSNINTKDAPITIRDSFPKEQLNQPTYNKPSQVSNPCVVEDDMDYFSVSSSDEVGDVEIDKKPVDMKPQKSYLSFGKSCVKIKKKNDKKVFLSFFNLFK